MDIFVVAIFVAVIYLVIMWYYRKQVIESYHNKYVFITGCDTGFGHLLAIRLDEMGFHVFAGCLTESGEDKLRSKSSQRLVTLSLDVTNEESILSAFEFIKSKLPKGNGLWGVVNNAGVAGEVGLVEWMKKENYERTLAVNLYGVTETCRIFLPLVRLSRGRFVNIASILGTVSSPATIAYSVSKHGVEVFSDILRCECLSHGITVHILEPGYFNTGIADVKVLSKSAQKLFDSLPPDIRAFYGEDYLSKLITSSESFLSLAMSDSVHKVVDAYVHALTAKYPKYRYKVGWDANTLFRVVRWSPEWLADFILGGRFPVPKGMRY